MQVGLAYTKKAQKYSEELKKFIESLKHTTLLIEGLEEGLQELENKTIDRLILI